MDTLYKIKLPILTKNHTISSHTEKVMAKKTSENVQEGELSNIIPSVLVHKRKRNISLLSDKLMLVSGLADH